MSNSSNISAFSQPKGLSSLFFIELWERFGFYALQAVLILYLTKKFGFSDDLAYDVFSATTSFMYATLFIGGYIADRWIGYRHSILLGAAILAAGYWLMMVPNQTTFYWALALLTVGNGFFKGCISTLLGTLYGENDSRRDGGYTIFYMGINIGSFIAPVIAGVVSEAWGMSFVFGFAGAGLVISMVIALLTFKTLGNKGLPPKPGCKPLLWVLLGSFFAVLLLAIVIRNATMANVLFSVAMLACAVAVTCIALRLKGHERSNMIVLIVLVLFSMLFWAIYTQTFSSLTLFTDRVIDRQLWGYDIPAAMFQSVNPFFIIVLTPVFVVLWNKVARQKSVFASPSVKFFMAIAGMALAYLVLAVGVYYHDASGHVSMFWLNLSYFFQTAAELMLSPIGLSLISELAPEQYRGMMMGGWFLSISAGYSMGDYLAKFTSIPTDLISHKSVLNMLPYYSHAFIVFFAIAAIVSVILLCLVPILNKATYSDKRRAAMNA